MNVELSAPIAEAFLHSRGWAVSKDREWFSPDGHISTWQLDSAVQIEITAAADAYAIGEAVA